MALSSALERFNRALDLIPFVETHPGWSIEELAQHFGVSAAEISKDLATLHMCGLPGYSHLELIDLTYDDDLVTILNSQNLSEPRDLTVDERAAILLGLEMMKGLSSAAPLIAKIDALQNRFRTIELSTIESQVDLSQAVNSAPHRDLLLKALEENLQLDIEYISARSNQISSRHIAPISVYQIGEHFYLEGYCFETSGVRHFRTDRMSLCQISDNTLAVPELDRSESKSETEISVLFEKSARLFLEEHRHLIISQEVIGERILARFAISDVDWLAKALLALPASSTILEPISAIERIAELAQRMKTLYS